MAGTFNQVLLLGRLGADPVLSHTPNGIPLVKFPMATERYMGPDRKVEADWHNVVVWNKTALAVKQYIKKGHRVQVVGPMVLNSWTTNEGQNRNRIEIHGRTVLFLENPKVALEPETNETFEETPMSDDFEGLPGDPDFSGE